MGCAWMGLHSTFTCLFLNRRCTPGARWRRPTQRTGSCGCASWGTWVSTSYVYLGPGGMRRPCACGRAASATVPAATACSSACTAELRASNLLAAAAVATTPRRGSSGSLRLRRRASRPAPGTAMPARGACGAVRDELCGMLHQALA